MTLALSYVKFGFLTTVTIKNKLLLPSRMCGVQSGKNKTANVHITPCSRAFA